MPEGSITSIELGHMRTDFTVEMDETCLIESVTSGGLLQTDGSITTESRTTIYSGICSIFPIVARRDRYDTYGEGHQYQYQYRVLVPWDTTGIEAGHRFQMTSSTDPDLVGRDMEVRDVHRVTDLAQRRITVHDLQD